MATVVPNPVINLLTGLLQLIPILNTNFAALNVALGERIVGQRLLVPGYSATGATTTRMPVGYLSPPGSTPWAVILVRANETSDPAKDLSVTTRVNFSREGQTLFVYEPSGLVANTKYDLGFFVIFDG
jgi:hypothetical protein